jgi:hypothetical protein
MLSQDAEDGGELLSQLRDPGGGRSDEEVLLACGSVIAAYSFFAAIPLPTTRHDRDLRDLASETARTTISWEDPP